MDNRIYISCRSRGGKVENVLRHGLQLPSGFISFLKYADEGILVNGNPARTVDRTEEGDIVAARIDDPLGKNPYEAKDCGVSVVYEDEYLAVINKPAGISTHGRPGAWPSVAANAAFLWGNCTTFHPVNRLDRGTSGLMVIAKFRLVHGMLQSQLHTDDFVREYVSIVCGEMTGRGKIDTPVDDKDALTYYDVIATSNNMSIVRLRLMTGRTHQIRKHLSGLGYPLAGDERYGGSTELIARPALHSASLSFKHPITGEIKAFSEPLPEDMKTAWQLI